ncbi:hypothetical protein AMECASPLE_005273 [Ameca splendens]|uniref:Interleukin-2 receptor subunit beta N-terminal domain-containing protein n=1 Tax=Ameca splendens TaxID=208324 RepID=A0ABV0YAG6_9TELE
MSPAVEMLWSLCMLLVLLPVDPADAHTGSPGLLCTNDFVNNVSCSWTRSWIGSAENCWITGVKRYWKSGSRLELIAQSCKLKQHRNSSLGCSFVFEKTVSALITI